MKQVDACYTFARWEKTLTLSSSEHSHVILPYIYIIHWLQIKLLLWRRKSEQNGRKSTWLPSLDTLELERAYAKTNSTISIQYDHTLTCDLVSHNAAAAAPKLPCYIILRFTDLYILKVHFVICNYLHQHIRCESIAEINSQTRVIVAYTCTRNNFSNQLKLYANVT